MGKSLAATVVLLAGLLSCVLGSVGCASTPDPDELYQAERKARTHYGVAIEHLREGRVAIAIRELRAAHELDPEDPWILLSLAECYRLKGLPDEAESHLLRALDLDPSFQPGRLNLSALYLQEERYAESIRESQTLIDDPTFPVPWKALSNLGWAQHQIGSSREARQNLELALEYHPDYWPALLNLAVIDADEGRRLDALRRLERLIEIAPGSLPKAEAHFRMAEIYVSLGNRAKAMHHLTAATEARPNGEWGRRSEDYLSRLR